jgi:hypothetical protein
LTIAELKRKELTISQIKAQLDIKINKVIYDILKLHGLSKALS